MKDSIDCGNCFVVLVVPILGVDVEVLMFFVSLFGVTIHEQEFRCCCNDRETFLWFYS